MEDKHRSIVKQQSGIWRSLRDGDFEEEEVWDVLKHRTDYHHSTPGIPKSKVVASSSSSSSSSSPIPVPRSLPTASRMMTPFPRASSSNNSTSSTSSSHEAQVVLQQSAPVNIPHWSKIYNRRNNKKNKASNNDVSRFDHYGFDHFGYDDGGDGGGGGDGDEEYEDDDDDDDDFDPKLAPHEVIARRLARSQISSFSVFEGVGRTLKGRDLSKVRNAVLTKTGFLESL